MCSAAAGRGVNLLAQTPFSQEVLEQLASPARLSGSRDGADDMVKIRRAPVVAGMALVMLTMVGGLAQAETAALQAVGSDRADQLLGSASSPDAAPPQAEPVVNDGEAYHRAPDERQDPAELRTTQALNDEVVSRNQLIDNQERADRVTYEAAAAQSLQVRLAYEEGLRQAEVDAEAAQRQWERDYARWEADARACEAGDRSRCAPPR